MDKLTKSLDTLVGTLEEQVKELNCMYRIEELLYQPETPLEETLERLVQIIPSGFQYNEDCQAELAYREMTFRSKKYEETEWSLSSDIVVRENVIGWIKVCYLHEHPELDIGPFLAEEHELLKNVAYRVGQHLMYIKLKMVFNQWENTKSDITKKRAGEWQVVLELLRRTDPDLFIRISRKMLNYLMWNGVDEAEQLLQQFNPYARYQEEEVMGESNIPLGKAAFGDIYTLSQNIFELARQHLDNALILGLIQKWMQEDKTSFLVRATANIDTSLDDIYEALRRYYQINPAGMELSDSTRIGVRASLVRRIFSDQLEFINIAKNFVRVSDFYDLMKRMIFPTGSHGKLGGKSAGAFLASRIVRASEHYQDILRNIKTPRTWHITSDGMIIFMHYNNMEEILEQKYKPLEEVRREYPHVVQLFKNSHFPPEIAKSLSVVLDDFGDRPIIVRSSSLLEDRLGSAFSGKYKSLFLANQGSKNQRLEDLMDAIAEVYASTIGPDPIEYRAERNLLDFHEEMGIMIQEVVGQRVGRYFLPAVAGVAFSNNEFRWSPRIKREDGLLRMVPGLGTRAVDRLGDDYPVLIAPGQPGLRANVDPEEIIRYSPHKMDVLNLESNRFETIEIQQFLQEYGHQYPMIEKLVSVIEHRHLRNPGFNTDFSKEDAVFTFEGLLAQTPFIKQMHTLLQELQNKLKTPVDIEFAHNGKHLFLLQCRPQSFSSLDAAAPIPVNINEKDLVFSAHRYVSNGCVSDIQYIVYVVPEKYNEISDLPTLKRIGRAVSMLNKALPKRKFILMGPGRWGSRGDIKLGVSVTYSDINNTAMLIEIARKKGNYVPDLSFGTHFFQDLVEASIRYLPLYPDEPENHFNEEFFNRSDNRLAELAAKFADLSEAVRVIDVPQASGGRYMDILMNGEENRAVAVLRDKQDDDCYEEQ